MYRVGTAAWDTMLRVSADWPVAHWKHPLSAISLNRRRKKEVAVNRAHESCSTACNARQGLDETSIFKAKYSIQTQIIWKEVSKPHLDGKLGTNKNQHKATKRHKQSILLLQSRNNLFSVRSL